MTDLVKYDAARRALAEAKAIDEVKDIHDKAEAMRAYGRMAKDLQLEIDAAEIRVRAERRLGELIMSQRETIGLGKPGPKTELPSQSAGNSRIALQDIGIDHKLSSRAQRTAGIGEQAFESMIGQMRERIADRGGRVSLDLASTADKQNRRETRERELAEKQTALPTQKFGVIYADPEWRFEPYSRESGMDRAADNHYPTSATEVICARPVGDIAADDCVLFLWATVPMLPDALKVMAAWGFTYKSHCIWTKDRVGTGYWFRNAHELLLLGTRGNIPAPAPGTQWPSTIEARVGKHSAKPEFFAELIEQYFPSLPKIELNRRGPPRAGWSAWGNEAVTAESNDAPLTERESTETETPPETKETIDPETGEITEIPRQSPAQAEATEKGNAGGDHDEVTSNSEPMKLNESSTGGDAENSATSSPDLALPQDGSLPNFLKRQPVTA